MGVHPHPGPCDDEKLEVGTDASSIIMSTVNVTSMGNDGNQTIRQKVLNYESHIMIIQEHAVAEGAQAKLMQDFSNDGWSMLMGPCMMECSRRTGDAQCIEIKACTKLTISNGGWMAD